MSLENFNSNIEFFQPSGQLAGSSGLFFKDINLSESISLSETGENGLVSIFLSASVIGALNELKNTKIENQTSLNSLSGVVFITSPDGTILIGDNDQTIELSGLFTQASGAVLQQKCEDLIILSGLIGVGGADQTSIKGISGIVDLDSPDESVNIQTNEQTIELTTPSGYAPSGASFVLIDYNDNDHLTDAHKLNATSGIVLDDQGARSVSGVVIKLDFDNEPTVNQVLSWNGSKLRWVDDQIGGGGGAGGVERAFTPSSGTLFVVEHGLNTTAFVWSMWQTHEGEQDLDPILSMVPITVSPSGNDHAIVNIDVAVSGLVVFVG